MAKKKCLHGMWCLSQSYQVQEGICSELMIPKSTLCLFFSTSNTPFSQSTSYMLSAKIFELLVRLFRLCMMTDFDQVGRNVIVI